MPWLAAKHEKGHILAATRMVKARRLLSELDQSDRNSARTLIEIVAVFDIVDDSDFRGNCVEMIQQLTVFARSYSSR